MVTEVEIDIGRVDADGFEEDKDFIRTICLRLSHFDELLHE